MAANQKSILEMKKKEAELARQIRDANKETAKITKELLEAQKEATANNQKTIS